MAKVIVLEPFADYAPGQEVEVPDHRVPYLKAKGLAKESTGVSSSPETSAAQPENDTIEQSLLAIGLFFGVQREPNEPLGEFSARLADSVVSGLPVHLPLESSQQPETIKETKEGKAPRLIDFSSYIAENVEDRPYIAEVLKKYPTPESLSGATSADLIAIDEVTLGIVTRLKQAARDYMELM